MGMAEMSEGEFCLLPIFVTTEVSQDIIKMSQGITKMSQGITQMSHEEKKVL